MQGYNGQSEGDKDPLHLCLVCLRKLSCYISPMMRKTSVVEWCIGQYQHVLHTMSEISSTEGVCPDTYVQYKRKSKFLWPLV